jgi:hypothetical protein
VILDRFPGLQGLGDRIADAALGAIRGLTANPAHDSVSAIQEMPVLQPEGTGIRGMDLGAALSVAGHDPQVIIEDHHGFLELVQVFAEGNPAIFGEEMVPAFGAKGGTEVGIGMVYDASNDLMAMLTEDIHGTFLIVIENSPFLPCLYYPSNSAKWNTRRRDKKTMKKGFHSKSLLQLCLLSKCSSEPFPPPIQYEIGKPILEIYNERDFKRFSGYVPTKATRH